MEVNFIILLIIILLIVSKFNFNKRYVPKYNKRLCTKINNNKPNFTKDEITNIAFETYSKLDKLGRCGVAFSCIGKELMPIEDRKNISSVKPSGWQRSQYRHIDGRSLYNRCHLIGFQLTAENANKNNLITGTRYFNVEGMLPFENVVASYIKKTNNHVMYRVTPKFKFMNLIASGVQIEALSVEDNGRGICFNVFIENIQPGIHIDYRNGNNWRVDMFGREKKNKYIINVHTKKIHTRRCCGAKKKYKTNKKYKGYKSDLLKKGYRICTNCFPE